MRKLVFFALAATPMLACTAILGDYTVGSGDGGDGGGDVVVGDSQPDGPSQEAGPDSGLRLLTCGEDNGARAQLNTTTGLQPWDRMAIGNLSAGRVRVVAAANNSIYAFTLDSNHNVNVTSISTNIWQLLDIIRLKDRFIAVTYGQDSSMQNAFSVYQIKDGDTAWGSQVVISPENPMPGGANRIQATVFPFNPDTNDYFLVVYDTENADTQAVLRAGRENASGTLQPLVSIDSSQPVFQYELKSPSLVTNASQAFLMLGANGPSTTDALLYTMDLTAPVASQPRKIVGQPAGAAVFPIAFTNSQQQGLVDVAVIEADLNAIKASYHVGQVGFPQMATFDPATLPASAPPLTDAGVSSIPDLLIDKGTSSVESFPNSENVLAVARTSGLSGPTGGFNFEWWDAPSGAVRAQQTGATHLLGDVNDAYRGAITFGGPPLASLAQFVMAFAREPNSSNQPQPGDLWITTVSCVFQ
jgi:hypothetical protein